MPWLVFSAAAIAAHTAVNLHAMLTLRIVDEPQPEYDTLGENTGSELSKQECTTSFFQVFTLEVSD